MDTLSKRIAAWLLQGQELLGEAAAFLLAHQPPAPPPAPEPAPPPAPEPAPPPAPEPAPPPAPLPPSPPEALVVPFDEGLRYRVDHRRLFQGTSWITHPARIAGGSARTATFGPNVTNVDHHVGWTWERSGGDWVDVEGTRWGNKPMFSCVTATGPLDLVRTYSVDVTRFVNEVVARDTWCAMRLIATKAARKLAGMFNPDLPIPSISVSYEDGTTGTLACVYSTSINPGLPMPGSFTNPTPMFLEFDRPTGPVVSAVMTLTVTEHSGNTAAVLEGYLLDPKVQRLATPITGVALAAKPLDEDLDKVPSIIGVHRYLDNSVLEDFVMDGKFNTLASREFDPALWGGVADTTKFPHKGLGKFITANIPNWAQIVKSDYADEGFKPLAPGLAAMRLSMAVEAHNDGDVVGYGGTGQSNATIFMPEPLFGRLPSIFVRHYMRIGTPGGGYVRNPEDRLHVYHKPDQVGAVWTDWGGKWGITPEHHTSYGGTSGSAGGGNGWQMRLSWSDCDGGVDGPNEGGFRPGYHLFDFGVKNPPGHSYAGDTGAKASWGQQGGLGGMLYADQWYCVETELKMNTVMPEAPGFLADGELRAWVDGQLVFERKGLVFRTLPLIHNGLPQNEATMPPVRELGIRALWLNWYHGGVTQNSVPRTMFISGLAYGTEYIGPMRK